MSDDESTERTSRRLREQAPEPEESEEESLPIVDTSSASQETPRLEREDATVSSVIANASGEASDGNSSHLDYADEDKPPATGATREKMMMEMRADIERYDRQREQEFGRQHGYQLHSRASAEAGGDGEEPHTDYVSSERPAPRSLPLASPRRERTRAAAAGRRRRGASPNWHPNGIGDFAEYIARSTTGDGSRDYGSNRRQASAPRVPGTGNRGISTTNLGSREEDDVRDHHTYLALPQDEAVIFLHAYRDGIGSREGRNFFLNKA